MDEPKNKREARKWVREHWAYLIQHADMGAVGDIGNDHIDEIWSDECERIHKRLTGART